MSGLILSNRRKKYIFITKNDDTLSRFFSFLDEKPNGCLDWTRALDTKGHGLFYISNYRNRKITISTHIFAFILWHKRMPVLDLHHSCFNPKCCNALHLMEVTHQEHKFIHLGRTQW